MPWLQRLVQQSRKVVPRGWGPILRLGARVFPRLRRYPARMEGGDRLLLDLRQPMCAGYLLDGGMPHNRRVREVLEDTLCPGAGFVDVGANVGFFTRMASRLVGPAGRVHALEPDRAALDILRMNVRDLPNVELYPVAAGAEPGLARFYERRDGDRSSLTPEGARVKEVAEAQVEPLDRVLAVVPRVDLIKIDVEGSELDVLLGATATLRRHRPVLCFEYLPEMAERRGFTLADFEDLLGPLGYELDPAGEPARVTDVVARPARPARPTPPS